jgi:MOSC domain-containing protein YiiM
MPRLIAVSAGLAAPLFALNGAERFSTLSAIRKHPISTMDAPMPCRIGAQGVEGDESVERRIHGPPFQAVYVYPVEHYEFWRGLCRQFGRPEALAAGSLGENLTVEGISESDVWIGDLLAVGNVRLRVTRSREPCFKLNAHLGLSMAAKMMIQSGFTGFYCAVDMPGIVMAGDAMAVIPGERSLSVLEQHRLTHDTPQRPLF